jgi:ABC-type bacteriocin/lantibiotic exporter with double-glycine peptidase domain
MNPWSSTRRWFVPEVIQTSGLDCGPASLKSLLAGFEIHMRYGRLREACQVDIDGSSIDVIEDLAVQLGLAAAQYIVPVDHLLMDEAAMLPCMLVTRQPNGLTHFVVVWRRLGGLVQVMDPANGRVWRTRRRLLQDAFIHGFPVAAEVAFQWLTAPAFVDPLRRRMADLGCPEAAIERHLERAQADEAWLRVAALDAATRMVAKLVAAGAIRRGFIAAEFVARLAAGAAQRGLAVVPAPYWSVRPLPDGQVELRGAVILHVAARTDAPADDERGSPAAAMFATDRDEERPVRTIAAAVFAEAPAALASLPLALLLAGAGVAVEALLLQRLVAATGPAPGVLALVVSFLAIALVLNVSIAAVLQRLGRWIDVHLRIRLLEKLPRLGNYYFHSRLTSDLAYRAHELRALRGLPQIAADLLRVVSEAALTVAGLVWLQSGPTLSVVPVVAAALGIFGLPFATLVLAREQELRVSVHVGTLSRFYLDSLRGLTAIQAHSAEEPVRSEHEALLARWAAASRASYWTHLAGLGVVMAAGTAFALWSIGRFVGGGGDRGALLLVVVWSLKLPALAQELANGVRRWPGAYNRLLRLFEVLGASEELAPGAATPRAGVGAGVGVAMQGVAVVAGGHPILTDVALAIRPGEHVAIVGASGSGKTSLVGLLLGWHRAAAGTITVDEAPLDAAKIQQLRRETAWVDPAATLWNRSLAANLRYGNADVSDAAVDDAAAQASLTGVIERLPGGLAGGLGEGGGLVSGGEGQRVRLARALLRPRVRLAILDEPFRGLEGDLRRGLLAVARQRWRSATLLYVSHDIDSALGFERVVVVDGGRVVEDGAPAELLAREGSRLAALRAAQQATARELWGAPPWRRWWMERGELRGP